jgi:hypothetical protein
MQVRFSKAGCLWSIILSIVLTVLLNLALRACANQPGRGDSFEDSRATEAYSERRPGPVSTDA